MRMFLYPPLKGKQEQFSNLKNACKGGFMYSMRGFMYILYMLSLNTVSLITVLISNFFCIAMTRKRKSIKMVRIFKVKFNTEFPTNSKYAWRVFEVREDEWVELFTQHIRVNAFSEITSDRLVDGTITHHLTLRSHRVVFDQPHEDGGFENIVFH